MAGAMSRGFAARVLPEDIWRSLESLSPPPSISQAMSHINTLLAGIPGAQPISRTWYREHAARRKQNRIGLRIAESAVKRPLACGSAETPVPAKAARAEPVPSHEACSPSESFIYGAS